MYVFRADHLVLDKQLVGALPWGRQLLQHSACLRCIWVNNEYLFIYRTVGKDLFQGGEIIQGHVHLQKPTPAWMTDHKTSMYYIAYGQLDKLEVPFL